MATRSYIGIKEGNHIFYIYCHWDGYIAHNGAILQKSYQDEDKIRDLINIGDLSALGSEIGEEHDFLSDDKNICTAYHRDRNEALNIGTMGVRGKSFDEICELVLNTSWCEFFYMWDTDTKKWYVGYYLDNRMLPLEEELKNSKKNKKI